MLWTEKTLPSLPLPIFRYKEYRLAVIYNHVFHSLPLKSVISGSIYPLLKVHLHLTHLFSSDFNITILIFQFPLVFVKFLSFC